MYLVGLPSVLLLMPVGAFFLFFFLFFCLISVRRRSRLQWEESCALCLRRSGFLPGLLPPTCLLITASSPLQLRVTLCLPGLLNKLGVDAVFRRHLLLRRLLGTRGVACVSLWPNVASREGLSDSIKKLALQIKVWCHRPLRPVNL